VGRRMEGIGWGGKGGGRDGREEGRDGREGGREGGEGPMVELAPPNSVSVYALACTRLVRSIVGQMSNII
jgi:hypothetical protein